MEKRRGILLAFLFGIFVFSLAGGVSAAGPTFTSYTGCSDPSLDTGGRTCQELTNPSTACQTFSTADRYYLLMTNITRQNQNCFVFNSPNVELNMNSHTIHFSQETGNYQQITLNNVATGSSAGNGYVIQDNNGPAVGNEGSYVSSISCDQCKIHDLYVYTWSFRMKTVSLGGGSDTNFNTIDNYVEVVNLEIVNDDTQVDGAFQGFTGNIHIEMNRFGPGNGVALIHDNIMHGPGAYLIDAIRYGSSRIYNNFLYPKTFRRNAYAIRVYNTGGIDSQDSTYIYNNTIISDEGKGIEMTGAKQVYVYNNFLNLSDKIYAAIEGSSEHAIRMRYGTSNTKIYNNTVIARSYSGQYPAFGLRLSANYPGGTNNTISDNTFVALSTDPSNYAIAVTVEGDDLPSDSTGNIFERNVIQSNDIAIAIGEFNGGADNSLFISNTIEEVPSVTHNFNSVYFSHGTSVNNLNATFRNTNFLGGASFNDISYHVGQNQDYHVEWFLDTVIRDNNVPISIPATTVMVNDSTGAVVYSGSLVTSVPRLALEEYFATAYGTSTPSFTNYTPHNVTVTYLGETQWQEVFMNESQGITFDFYSTGNSPDVNSDGDINVIDLAMVIFNYGRPVDGSGYDHLDVDGDSLINFADAQLVASYI